MSRTLEILDLGRRSYREALELMEARADARVRGEVSDALLLVENSAVFTLGRRGKREDVLLPEAELHRLGIDVVETGRGGEVTYHGPGQLVGYPVLDLRPDRPDVRRYVRDLEEVLIRTAADFGVSAERVEGRVGIWAGDDKIGAIGVRISRWVTSHGFALNVTAESLGPFAGIVPCGIRDKGVSALEVRAGRRISLEEARAQVIANFLALFGDRP